MSDTDLSMDSYQRGPAAVPWRAWLGWLAAFLLIGAGWALVTPFVATPGPTPHLDALIGSVFLLLGALGILGSILWAEYGGPSARPAPETSRPGAASPRTLCIGREPDWGASRTGARAGLRREPGQHHEPGPGIRECPLQHPERRGSPFVDRADHASRRLKQPADPAVRSARDWPADAASRRRAIWLRAASSR